MGLYKLRLSKGRYIVFLGAPGAGKGTQAAIVAQELKLAHIAPGDLFRQAQEQGTDLAMKAKSYMEKGMLVPDEITIQMVLERISAPDCEGGAIFDGFPRNLKQAELLKKITEIDLVVYLYVSDETLNRTARKLLSNGAVYFCAFGPDCERVHDRIDDQIRDMNLEDNDEERLILTTWHSSEPLEDALWYFLYSSSPSEAYWSQCNSWVLVSIGAHSLSAEIRAAFSNVEQFNETVLAKIPDDEEEES